MCQAVSGVPWALVASTLPCSACVGRQHVQLCKLVLMSQINGTGQLLTVLVSAALGPDSSVSIGTRLGAELPANRMSILSRDIFFLLNSGHLPHCSISSKACFQGLGRTGREVV